MHNDAPRPPVKLTAKIETWPLSQPFVISRGAKSDAVVVVVTANDGHVSGWGECVPYARYGECVDGVLNQIQSHGSISDRTEIFGTMPAGAARNAVDCALWDYEAKRAGVDVSDLLDLGRIDPAETAYTLSLGSPEDMATQAASVPDLRLLKLKLGGEGDLERMELVRRARPDARLIADANEAWPKDSLQDWLREASALNFELIEQPLVSGDDGLLSQVERFVPVCADESLHTVDELGDIKDRYDAVNVKLDKAGGLTVALELTKGARAHGLKIMIGSMVGTSLSMAPALHLAPLADWVDLDSPLLLAKDREHGLVVRDGWIQPPSSKLWG